MTCVVSKLHSSLKDFPPRGGASAVEVNNKILVFGGADREQTHFQDILVYSGDGTTHFGTVRASGDKPMPRSGHSAVAFGKYMLLFGGIDFTEEIAFNDLYILDTDTYEWGYIGESGLEVIARNSHSLGIVGGGSQKQYIVIYGGASPEHGPLGDTIYSELPDVATLDLNTFHVTWQLLQTAPVAAPESVFSKATDSSNLQLQPGSREMHGTCSFGGSMYISGGRSVDGNILSDVWSLSVAPTPASAPAAADGEVAADTPGAGAAPVLVWKRCTELELPTPRCAHGAAVVFCDTAALGGETAAVTKGPAELSGEAVAATSAAAVPSMMLIGGFTGAGISSEAIVCPLSSSATQAASPSAQWSAVKLTMPIAGRFGLTMCAVSASIVGNMATNKKYAPVFSNKAKENFAKITARQSDTAAAAAVASVGESKAASQHAALVLFGGVCIEQDYGDVYLLTI